MSSSIAWCAIPQLPVDIYLEILKLLPTSRDETSVNTLVNCLHTNSLVRTAALSPLVWEHHYHARYMHCIEENEARRKDETGGDWRLLYIERRLLDRRALRLADEIRLNRSGRHQRAREFAKILSFDVWDALRLESQIPVPSFFRGVEEYASGPDVDRPGYQTDALPKRFWAQAILGMIARHEGVGIWTRVFSSPADVTPVSFVEMLASLSSAFGVSMREISLKLDEIYHSCLVELEKGDTQLNPDGPGYNLQTLCVKLRAALHNQGFKLAIGRDFQRLLNQFPHAFLEPEYRETIPMSLVFVFVAVTRRLGIEASPLSFPGAVQAHIASSDPSMPDFILDMGTESALSSVDTHNPPWEPIQGLDILDSTRPAPADVMLLRVFNNVLLFVRFERTLGASAQSRTFETHDSAFYVISMCHILRTQEVQAIPPAPDFNPLDLVAVSLDALAPALNPVPRSVLTQYCEEHWKYDEEQAREVHPRASTDATQFVGLVFRHARYQYVGCIYGWNPHCMAPESWIQEMRVDDLPDGRHQPFYNTIATDGRSRYVAQENIHPIFLTHQVAHSLFNARASFGRYFIGVDIDDERQRGRLTISHELRAAYPDDDAAGALWVHGSR